MNLAAPSACRAGRSCDGGGDGGGDSPASLRREVLPIEDDEGEVLGAGRPVLSRPDQRGRQLDGVDVVRLTDGRQRRAVLKRPVEAVVVDLSEQQLCGDETHMRQAMSRSSDRERVGR